MDLYFSSGEFSYTKDTCMNLKHNWSEICMRFHTNDKTIIADNYENDLDIIKQKLYSGDYGIRQLIHRLMWRIIEPAIDHQVSPSKDISMSINENPPTNIKKQRYDVNDRLPDRK